MELKHRRCCFRRSASSCLMTPMRTRSSRISSSDSQSAGVVRPGLEPINSPVIQSTVEKTKKPKGFFSFLFGKRSRKSKKVDHLNGNNFSFAEHDVRKLIRLYCKHDNLYNPKNLYYGNKEIDEDCYNDMMRSFPGKSSSQLRSCIEELKILFEREYTIIEKARRKYGERLTPSIRYYNEFLFLVPHLSIDFEKELPDSGKSLMSAGKLPSTDLKNQIATTEMLCHKLTNFTGFPLAAFPGSVLLKRLKTRNSKERENRVTQDQKEDKITEQEDQEKETPSEQRDEMKEVGSEQETQGKEQKEQEDQQQKVTFSPSSEQKSIDYSEEGISRNRITSDMSTQSSYYVNEQDLKTTDLTCSCRSDASQKPVACPWRPENTPCVAKCQVTVSNSTQKSVACPRQPENAPCVSGCRVDPTELGPKSTEVSENKTSAQSGNNQQVQMLCDMIRTELSSAPDFIYFDAKWRIIEILREVHKRQLVHQKAVPQHNPRRPVPPQKRISGEHNIQVKNQKYKTDRNTQEKPGAPRICDHLKCPYCCRNN